jgi:hypothetical protein
MAGINKNAAGGIAIFAFGAFYGGYAMLTQPLGSFASMGPGMFPFCIGMAMAAIGALILFGEARRSMAGTGAAPPWERIEWRSFAAVVLSMSAFALTNEFFGVIPAIFALCAIAAIASNKLTPLTVVLLSAALSLASWLIFTLTLKLPFSLFEWPF